jgi:RNA polymerase sigma-70 factor (ECF subfamily)
MAKRARPFRRSWPVSETASLAAEAGPVESAATFETFFETEHRRLFRAMYLVTGNLHEAEELMQDAFLRLWERWDRVSVLEDPTGYLYRTAMNAFRSRYRRTARAARRAIRPGAELDAFADIDERDRVGRAVALLPPRQRAAIVLTELLGYPSDEAGSLMGVKAVTVRALASQARAALRTAMESSDE